MRLLKRARQLGVTHTTEYGADEIPPYAILSHTWDDGREVSFEDIRNGDIGHGSGKSWHKVVFCARRAAQDGLRYFWIDSCCIDRTNKEEHHSAINAMYEWYHKSTVCYAYLTDVTSFSDLPRSRWWTRGWTLQELLAPRCVLFFNRLGECLGDKSSLENMIVTRTTIPANALRGWPLTSFSIEARLSWIGDRQTKFPEDLYNCLRGILGHEKASRFAGGRRRAAERAERTFKLEQVRKQLLNRTDIPGLHRRSSFPVPLGHPRQLRPACLTVPHPMPPMPPKVVSMTGNDFAHGLVVTLDDLDHATGLPAQSTSEHQLPPFFVIREYRRVPDTVEIVTPERQKAARGRPRVEPRPTSHQNVPPPSNSRQQTAPRDVVRPYYSPKDSQRTGAGSSARPSVGNYILPPPIVGDPRQQCILDYPDPTRICERHKTTNGYMSTITDPVTRVAGPSRKFLK